MGLEMSAGDLMQLEMKNLRGLLGLGGGDLSEFYFHIGNNYLWHNMFYYYSMLIL